jgi:hypothetical protein
MLVIINILFGINNILLILTNIKGEKMKEKLSILAGLGVAVLIIVLIGFYLMGSEKNTLSDLLLIIIPLVLIVGVITILWDRIKNLKTGLPNSDERAKKLHWKAGAYAYYATIWIAVGSLWYNIIFADELGFPSLNAGQIVAVIVLLSGICWFALQFYFMKKGDIE